MLLNIHHDNDIWKIRNKQSAVKPFQNQEKSVNYVLGLLLNTMDKSYAGRNILTAVLTD